MAWKHVKFGPMNSCHFLESIVDGGYSRWPPPFLMLSSYSVWSVCRPYSIGMVTWIWEIWPMDSWIEDINLMSDKICAGRGAFEWCHCCGCHGVSGAGINQQIWLLHCAADMKIISTPQCAARETLAALVIWQTNQRVLPRSNNCLMCKH